MIKIPDGHMCQEFYPLDTAEKESLFKEYLYAHRAEIRLVLLNFQSFIEMRAQRYSSKRERTNSLERKERLTGTLQEAFCASDYASDLLAKLDSCSYDDLTQEELTAILETILTARTNNRIRKGYLFVFGISVVVAFAALLLNM